MNILVSTAHAEVDMTKFAEVVDPIITHIVNPLIMLVFTIAFVVFVYGVFQVVWGGEEGRDKGKSSMWGGIIGMFIMLSAWGIIYLVANTVTDLVK